MLCIWAEACVSLWLGLCESGGLLLGGMEELLQRAAQALKELFVSVLFSQETATLFRLLWGICNCGHLIKLNTGRGGWRERKSETVNPAAIV